VKGRSPGEILGGGVEPATLAAGAKESEGEEKRGGERRWAGVCCLLLLFSEANRNSAAQFQNLRTHTRHRQGGRACHTHHRAEREVRVWDKDERSEAADERRKKLKKKRASSSCVCRPAWCEVQRTRDGRQLRRESGGVTLACVDPRAAGPDGLHAIYCIL
jgi:hypothetical protein